MIHRPAFRALGLIAAVLFAAAPGAQAASAPVEARVVIQYSISMIGVPVGRITWAIDLGPQSYQTSANGKASRAVSIWSTVRDASRSRALSRPTAPRRVFSLRT